MANILELERAIILSLRDKIKLWKSYVDDTIAFVKTDAIKNVDTQCGKNLYNCLS